MINRATNANAKKRLLICTFVVLQAFLTPKPASASDSGCDEKVGRAVLLTAKMISDDELDDCRERGLEVVLLIQSLDNNTKVAAKRVKETLGRVDYFFEVARNETIANKHPLWMASIQGHGEWMRLFPGFVKPGKNEIVKVYPWVPIFYAEAQKAHLERIAFAIKNLPAPNRVWLNDVQGAPSACGCGHPLCRWTSDYGKVLTATKMGDEAPANFITKVQSVVGSAKIIPILTSECEKDDEHTTCGGVGCFEGACWKAFSRQLDLVATKVDHIGVACFYKEFDRDLERYGQEAGWVKFALQSFESMPKLRDGKGVPTDRLIAVLQGWNVNNEELDHQIKIAQSTNVAGILICKAKIEQDWQPKVIKLPANSSDK